MKCAISRIMCKLMKDSYDQSVLFSKLIAENVQLSTSIYCFLAEYNLNILKHLTTFLYAKRITM